MCYRACITKFRHSTVHHAHADRPGIHQGVKSIGGVEGSLLLVLCRCFQYFPYKFLYTVHICTPYLGGVRSEADVAKFCYTNKEQIFERSCRDIDTVRNVDILARSDLLGY